VFPQLVDRGALADGDLEVTAWLVDLQDAVLDVVFLTLHKEHTST
jgi:hypothetical protein